MPALRFVGSDQSFGRLRCVSGGQHKLCTKQMFCDLRHVSIDTEQCVGASHRQRKRDRHSY